MTPVDVVLIGRNEGQRLIDALASVDGQARQLVYVDSGSTDNSVAEAQKTGATVVSLDMSVPFTAARARNAGFAALHAHDYVLFIDGDCSLVPGFVDAARDHLDGHDEVGLVTGWRSEMRRDESLYNQLCDWEWHRPAGEIATCGGDMMVRARIWAELGGMNPQVIAAEDDEFCQRLRKAGWQLHRIPVGMTRHDAAMSRFSQWWKRAVRTGHGFAQVSHLHPDFFVTERRRVLVYGLALPLAILLSLFLSPWLTVALLGLYPLNYIRTAQSLIREGLPGREAFGHALLLTLSKFPNLIGMAKYLWRYLSGSDMHIIEYK
ncbi:glycosyl transferase [Roseovarius atlanticus]|uniref:Glycosyl transferase n=1 Tax=Roseovarius atlanticus TaxID=1641875 RepID=A0A0T5NSI3_9RHOB|nr:glycosyltransferase [Roseovarius atlanticus]KRS11897.1 glycosyl transferase [Roseovarius atlanticus]